MNHSKGHCQVPGFPQGLENMENREKNNGQGKVREFYFWPKVREKSGNLFQNADCHENMLLFLSIIEIVCHGIHRYESAHVDLQEIYFLLF